MKKYRISENAWDHEGMTMSFDKALQFAPSAQAGVNHINGSIVLWSYATLAAEIAGNELYVTCLCSTSTRKHVAAFLKEYAPHLTYQDAKRAFMAGKPINIETGEIINHAAA